MDSAAISSAGGLAKDNEINQILSKATHEVNHYINEIKAQPDDFAHKHLKTLQKSIENAQNALVKHEFKKETEAIDFDTTLVSLDDAITFLITKRKEEISKAQYDESHAEIANEIVVAENAIQYLVALLVDIRERSPIRGVDLNDDSYKTGKKVERAGGKKFKDSTGRG